ncbi:MAG: outer rane efflux protein [Myxococcaceae bacterium]|nr:outer rane efflux protein [Myxococcaceae bacterium]
MPCRRRRPRRRRRATERELIRRLRKAYLGYNAADQVLQLHEELEGALLPDAPPAELLVWQDRLQQRPDLLAREQSAWAALLDSKAAGRIVIPDVRLEAGYKGVRFNPGRRTDGFLAGASLSLPLFDHGQGAQRAADAEARGQGAARELALGELRGEVASARETTAQMQTAAVHFRAESGRASANLLRIATAGYEGGEMGIFQLLDAYRGAVDDELTALDMELTSRRAIIELGRMTGGGVP